MHRAATAALALLLAGCPAFDIDLSEDAAAAVRAQDLGDLPYHPLVMHLDLSVLAYQSYSQTLAWPFDPYYEEPPDDDARDTLMDSVRAWASATGEAQIAADVGPTAFRGPGRLAGLPDNALHDPIVSQYSRLHPWSDTITNPDGTWTEYRTPRALTRSIGEVRLCTTPMGGEGPTRIDALTPLRDDAEPGARDVLLAIEGGTGDKGEDGQPASWSLMAVVLLRFADDDSYDAHIAFRGSRSGSGLRAVLGALSTEEAEGNPDWITDLGTRLIDEPEVSAVGTVFRGMATSLRSTTPQLFACLDGVAGDMPPPDHVYVTGHSLGGALAQHLASSLFLGTAVGPGGDAMPASLTDWPWDRLKLITYGAPRVGDQEWAETLTDELESQFFVTRQGSRWDAAAVGVTDLDIIPRLTDPDRPAAYRVLIPTDPITFELIVGAKHVGQTVYLEVPTAEMANELPNFDDHEPADTRALMWDTLRDDRIPPDAWFYREMTEIHPDRVEDEAGTTDEYQRLSDALQAWYVDRDLAFDDDAYEAARDTFLGLLP